MIIQVKLHVNRQGRWKNSLQRNTDTQVYGVWYVDDRDNWVEN